MSRRTADLRRGARRRGSLPLGHLVRQGLAAPGLLLLAFVVVALVAAAATLTPRLLAAAATDEVRSAVGPQAEPLAARTLVVSTPIGGSDEVRKLWLDTAAVITSSAETVANGLDPALAAVLTPPVVTVTSVELTTALADAMPVLLRFAFLVDTAPGADGTPGRADVTSADAGALTWLEGGPPADIVPTRPGVEPEPGPVEVVLSEATADLLDVHAGDALQVDQQGTPVDTMVAGVFRAVDPSARVWRPLPTALEPLVVGGSARRAEVIAITGPGSIPTARLAIGGDRITEQIRFDVLPEALDASSAGEIASAAAAVASAPSTLGLFGPRPTVTTRVDRALDAALARSAAVTAQAATVVSGALAVGLLVLGLATTVQVRRRAAVLAHQRAVGASLTTLAVGLVWESVVVVVLAGSLGAGVALTLAPGPVAWWWLAPTLLLAAAVGPVVGTLVAARSTAPPPARSLDHRRGRGAALRRPLAEVTLALVAAAALATLRLRGATASGGSLAADLVVLAAPALVAAAVAVGLVRVLPMLVRWSRRRATRRGGVVRLVGAARGRVPAVPVVALVLACALLTLAGSLLATIAAGQESGSWRAVGGDVVVTGAPDPGLPDLTGLAGHDGVVAVAEARVVPGVQLLGTGVDHAARLVVVDPVELARLIAATPLADASSADRLATLRDAGSPTAGEPVPALVSGLPEAVDAVTARWRDGAVPLTVVGPAPWLPLEATGATAEVTVVVSRQALEDVLGPVPTTVAWVVGPGAGAAVAGAAGLEEVDVLTRERWLAELRSSPSARTVAGVLVGAGALLLVMGLLVVALTASAGAPDRHRVVVALRVVGVPRRVAGRLALVELAAVVLPSTLVGAATGVLLAVATTGALGVAGLTGLGTPPPVVVPWWVLAVVPALWVVAALAARLGRRGPGREQLGEVLRAG